VRLQAKLALALIPLVVVPVLALGWLSWASMRADVQRDASHALDAALLTAEHALAQLVTDLRTNLRLLAGAAAVENYARADNDYDRYYLLQPTLLDLFYQYQDAYPEYVEIRFLTPDGGEDARIAAPGFDVADAHASLLRGLAEAASGTDDGSDPVLRLDAGDRLLRAYRRIALPEHYDRPASAPHHTHGWLAVTLSLRRSYARLARGPLGYSGELLLVDGDGRVVYDTSGRHRGGQLPESWQTRLRGAVSGSRELLELTLNGRRQLVRVRPVEPGLLAVAMMPKNVLMQPLHRLAVDSLTVTLLSGLLLALVLFGWLRRLVLRPLHSLREAAWRIGDGDLRPTIPVRSNDELGMLAAALREMGERLASYRDRVEHMAFHDQLTGLPNRRLIRELLAERLHDVRAPTQMLAVLFLDLDNFKQINDNLGHAAGDELLRTLTARLSRLLDDFVTARGLHGGTYLARFGGDELLVVLNQRGDSSLAAELAKALLDTAAKPVELGDARYVVTASIGIALYPQDARDADGLVRCADLAMYGAKARGRNTFRFYSSDLNARAAERLRIERRLRQAIAGGHLAVHYQPIVDLSNGGIRSMEALLRWTDPELGSVSPVRFIPIAEETGLIRDLALWTLHRVCAQIVAWRHAGLPAVPVAVNVSAAHLRRDDLAAPLGTCLAEHGLSGRDLELEITESVLMDLTAETTNRLDALAELGVALHIDDFGTGWSSLDYLRRFTIESIKIDRSFVAHICDNDEDRTLAEAMIAMAHALNLRVIAEGIEKPEQHALLGRLGCDQGQGYLFARPGDAVAASSLLAGELRRSKQRAAAIPAHAVKEASQFEV